MNYAKFTENNDNEGESWRFWIPLEGNEDVLAKIQSALDNSEEYEYEIDLTPVPEAEVDALVKHTGAGYMAYDNKLAGVLALPDAIVAQIKGDDDEDGRPLYKGGIKNYMKAEREQR